MGAVRIGNTYVGTGHPFVLIAGPCAIESEEVTLRTADGLAALTRRLGVPLIFKASFDKANRTTLTGARGVGIETGLRILECVRREFGVPVTTDVHEPAQVGAVAEVVDLLQIPAFLCRQTDLLVAAGATGRPVNVKKGQFLAPQDLGHAAAKLRASGDGGVLLTDRGTSFGYGDLILDLRSIPLMQAHAPAVIDVTHATQRPGGARTGGERRFAELYGRAALAAGADALFAEVHPDPARALSDADTQLPLGDFAPILEGWAAFGALDRALRAPGPASG